MLAAGAGRDVLSYRTLKVLADLDPAVAAVRGYTRYGIDGDTISIIDRGGISRDLSAASRATRNCAARSAVWHPSAKCSSGSAAATGEHVVFVPEVKAGETTGITLLHVAFHDRLPVDVMRGVLQGYDRRYDRLVDWVTETEGELRRVAAR